MINKFKTFLKQWSQWRLFKASHVDFRKIVFYSESRADFGHLELILMELINTHKKKVSYLASDKDDPAFQIKNDNLKVYYIGSGSVLNIAFRTIECTAFVMTLLDLDRFYLKRSVHNVHYVYTFHSLSSTHFAFRELAHHAYDTILCSGPHHIKEIRAIENSYSLKPKKLVEAGYARIDKLIEDSNAYTQAPDKNKKISNILILPSWGKSSIMETCIKELLTVLGKEKEFNIVLRPHPMTAKHLPELLNEVKNLAGEYSNIHLEFDTNSSQSMSEADIVISEWSGAAVEFAFVFNKPVLYINTPPKINNPNYNKINLEPFEAFIREEVGMIINIENLDSIKSYISEISASGKFSPEHLRRCRDQWVYNAGNSFKVSADKIIEIINEKA